MSTPISPEQNDEPVEQLYRKPRADVFTVMLAIALVAIILATVALWMVMADYGYKFKGAPVVMNRPAATTAIDVSVACNAIPLPVEQG